MKKVIIHESEHDSWYADKLGQEFKVHPSTQNYYYVVDGWHEGRTIKKEHCELVADFIDQDGNITTETIKEQTVQNSNQQYDNVTKPLHYHENGLDPLTVMEYNFTKEERIGFAKGNAIKYLLRYNKKNGVEDIKKSLFYINQLIELEGDPT